MRSITIARLKEKLHQIIFESDTWYGQLFNTVLMVLIFLNVIIVTTETVFEDHPKLKTFFYILEWAFTFLFTIEYLLRIWVVKKPLKYIFSFYGIIDLFAILPTYISMFYYGSQYLMVIRVLRLLRIFRIFKLGVYVSHGNTIIRSIKSSMPKITVFLYFVFLMVIVFGSVMYLIEGNRNPEFDSIPRGIYWAIITLTTVGYGDISPVTPLGQFVASIVMIVGYAVIAVPTGIISSEMVRQTRQIDTYVNSQHCIECGNQSHDNDAIYCKKCGHKL